MCSGDTKESRHHALDTWQTCVLGSVPLSLGVPSEELEEKGWAFGHRDVSLPAFSQSADKTAVQSQANSPQPAGCRLDDREQIKQKDKCSLGGSSSIGDSSDPGTFYPTFRYLFLLQSLALILLLKVTAGNTDAPSSCSELCDTNWADHMSFKMFSTLSLWPSCIYFHRNSLINWSPSRCGPGVKDAFRCTLYTLSYRFDDPRNTPQTYRSAWCFVS